MNSIDWYKSINFDASIVLNYPKGMAGVLSAVKDILAEQKKIVVEYDRVDVELARSLVSGSRDTTSYHVIDNADSAVWSILRNSVNEDNIRVLGIFHGKISDSVPENVITIDVGRSLHRKVLKNVVSAISDSVLTKGKVPNGKPEELYYGIMTLCYEVLFKPEFRVFDRKVQKKVFLQRAFDYMYNPPDVLNEMSMKSAVLTFMDTVHGDME